MHPRLADPAASGMQCTRSGHRRYGRSQHAAHCSPGKFVRLQRQCLVRALSWCRDHRGALRELDNKLKEAEQNVQQAKAHFAAARAQEEEAKKVWPPCGCSRPVWCLCCTSATRLLVYFLHHVSPYRTVSS